MNLKATLLPGAFAVLIAGCGTGGGQQQVLVGGTAGPSTVTASPAPLATITPAPTVASPSAGTASASPAATVTASATTSKSASPSPTSSSTSTLKESDSGRTITLSVGQSVTVDLPGGNGGYDRPQSSAAAMHRDSADGGYPSDQPAVAQFTAAQIGTADLTSTTDYNCLHTTPRCTVAQKQWVVHVVVRT